MYAGNFDAGGAYDKNIISIGLTLIYARVLNEFFSFSHIFKQFQMGRQIPAHNWTSLHRSLPKMDLQLSALRGTSSCLK